MLSLIKEKAESQNIGNIELIEVKNNHFNMEGNIIDLAVIVTVLHEVKNQLMFLAEVKRILKPDGNVAIIEFHKRVTPMGPSIDHRLSYAELSQILRECDFSEVYKFDLGQSFYCTVVKPNQKK